MKKARINQKTNAATINRMMELGTIPADEGWKASFAWEDGWKTGVLGNYTISALMEADPEYDDFYEPPEMENYKKITKSQYETKNKAEAKKYDVIIGNFDDVMGTSGVEYRPAKIGVYDEEFGQPDPEFLIGVKLVNGKAVAVIPYDYLSVLPIVTTRIDYLSRITGSMAPGLIEYVEGEFEARFESFMNTIRRFLDKV